MNFEFSLQEKCPRRVAGGEGSAGQALLVSFGFCWALLVTELCSGAAHSCGF